MKKKNLCLRKQLPMLRSVDLRGTAVNQSAVEELQSARPELRVSSGPGVDDEATGDRDALAGQNSGADQ